MVQFLLYNIDTSAVNKELADLVQKKKITNISTLVGESLERNLVKDLKLGPFNRATNTAASGKADIKLSKLVQHSKSFANFISSAFNRTKGSSGLTDPILPEVLDGLEVKGKALKLQSNKDGSFSSENFAFKIGGTTLSESNLQDVEKGPRVRETIEAIRRGNGVFKGKAATTIISQLKKDPKLLAEAKISILNELKGNNNFLRKIQLFTVPITIVDSTGKRRSLGVAIANTGKNRLTTEDLGVTIDPNSLKVNIYVNGASMRRIIKDLQNLLFRKLTDSKVTSLTTTTAIKNHPKGEKGFISDLLQGVDKKVVSISIGLNTSEELKNIVGNVNLEED